MGQDKGMRSCMASYSACTCTVKQSILTTSLGTVAYQARMLPGAPTVQVKCTLEVSTQTQSSLLGVFGNQSQNYILRQTKNFPGS